MKTKLFSRIFLCSILILFLTLSNIAFATDKLSTISSEENSNSETNTIAENILTTYETDYEFSTSDKFYYDSEVNIS